MNLCTFFYILSTLVENYASKIIEASWTQCAAHTVISISTYVKSPTSQFKSQSIGSTGYFPGLSLNVTVNLAYAARLTNLIVALKREIHL